jgi:uncharacterized protein (DUF362 family)
VKLHVKRRELLGAASALGLLSCAERKSSRHTQGVASPVAVLKASSYEGELLNKLEAGMKAVWPEAASALRGKRVVLKPNLVEFDSKTAINTDPRFTLAARELFLKLGAGSVAIAEGPGHRRDTWDLADQAGYRSLFAGFDRNFTDLNLDDVEAMRAFGNSMDLYLPKTILSADLVVSLAKMKTHHWAGATLSMKNFFGIVPGSIYGWPKNLLHHQGIETSIVELNRIVRNTFAIVDGVVAMEGNGPIQGTPVAMGALVMGRDLPAVDATCARLMRLAPEKIGYLREAAELRLGSIEEGAIEQRGEKIASLARPFAVVSQFSRLRLDS